MRRVMLAALATVTAMAALSSAAVGLFAAVGRSNPPEVSERAYEEATAGIGAPAATGVGDAAGDVRSGDGAASEDADPPDGSNSRADEQPRGLLSDAFTELGLDDPTTDVDESLPSPCTGLAAVPRPLKCQAR